MNGITRRAVLRGMGALGVGVGGLAVFPSVASAALTRVLVFSRTAGFRHDSIPAGIAAIRTLGSQNGFAVDATEDAGAFITANLAQYQAVVWLSTTGDVLNTNQQAAFESYVNGGGGYVGIHSAADTEYDWAWYGGCCGAYFLSHPAQQQASVIVEDRTTDSTAHLPATWSRFDEWYNYRTNPRSGVHVLMRLDESSYSGGTMGADHPITWWHDVGNGRAWYTGLGHTIESYADANFTRVLLGGIRMAAKAVPTDPSPGTGPVQTGVYYRLAAQHSGKLADISGVSTSAGALLHQWSATGGLNQQFDFLDSGGGYYRVRARHSGLVLQVASSNNGADITQQTDTAAASQQWSVLDRGSGVVSLVNRQSGLAMDVRGASTADGARISQWTSNGAANQRFQLQRV
ncbi:MAG TPA: ThuA domain-containing protein [Actinophytocola sp.]|nr:ThuA domain-containing protein [Actinophytocola sp.]HYQ64851.1 ThuA domain-containing protein [Actinophytocola sp.]